MIFPVNNRTATRCQLSSILFITFFTFSIQIMLTLISPDANDPQRVDESLSIKQTNIQELMQTTSHLFESLSTG